MEAEDAVEVLESSGLADRAYAWIAGSPAPTMRQLIETKKNVIVLAENHGGTVATLVQRRLRHAPPGHTVRVRVGGEDGRAQLLRSRAGEAQRTAAAAEPLARHRWPAPKSLADEVNSTDVLLARAETCAQQRGQIPNIVAVDFYSEGDLRRVVNRLNRVDVPEPVLAATPGLPP